MAGMKEDHPCGGPLKLFITNPDDVITMDDDLKSASAVLVAGKKVIAVGTEEDIRQQNRGKAVEVIDLKGKTIMPGLIDPHVHPVSEAEFDDFIDLNGFDGNLTGPKITKILRTHCLKTPAGEWVIAKGFNPMFPQDVETPTMQSLDDISTRHPIMIIGQNMHTYYANSMAFRLAGVTEDTPDPPGGSYQRDPVTGKLTGQFNEPPAAFPFCDAFPKFDEFETQDKIRGSYYRFAETGFTTISPMSMMSSGTLTKHCQAVESVGMEEDCPVRVISYQCPRNFEDPNYVPIETTREDNYHTLGYKFWTDGSPWGGTMAVKDAYMDTDLTKTLGFEAPPNFGILTQTYEGLYSEVLKYANEGKQLACHSHGERGIDLTLDIYEAVLKVHPKEDHRWRIEHCGLITRDQLERAKKIGATVSFFIGHIYWLGDRLRDEVIGQERAYRFMPCKSAQDTGHIWSVHADSPCFPISPFPNIKTAVLRMTNALGDKQSEQIGKDECVSLEDALKSVTVNAAWQLFQEDRIGKIKKGYQADFTITDRNIRKIDSFDIDTLKCIYTYKDGRKCIDNTEDQD